MEFEQRKSTYEKLEEVEGYIEEDRRYKKIDGCIAQSLNLRDILRTILILLIWMLLKDKLMFYWTILNLLKGNNTIE